jgi:hypothetical protein
LPSVALEVVFAGHYPSLEVLRFVCQVFPRFGGILSDWTFLHMGSLHFEEVFLPFSFRPLNQPRRFLPSSEGDDDNQGEGRAYDFWILVEVVEILESV